MRYEFTPRDIERFWRRVDKSDPDGCWLWTGKVRQKGRYDYGRFWLGGKTVSAHRVSYAIAHGGEIPDGMHACHHCDRPRCVRPSHLFLGTDADNIEDARKKGRLGSTRGRTYNGNHWTHREPDRVPRGEDNRAAKLTEAQVIEIRRRDAEGLAGRSAMAREYGVEPSLITMIVKRRIWKHVD